jgi:hypothetical protein
MKYFGWIRKQRFWFSLASLIGLAVLGYLLLGTSGHPIGFPLDDAWIHQTYAKNLAASGSWAYRGTNVSGGSTSPLWTLLISLGDLVSSSFGIVWTFILSIFAFSILVVFACRSLQQLVQLQNRWLYLIPCGVIATEWHLLWSVGSGMETILFSAVIILLFFLLLQEEIKWGLVGLLCGILVWIRPDGLTLLGPVLLILVIQTLSRQARGKKIVAFLLPLLALILAYAGFNWAITGRVFPNTFYAKQVEYQQLWSIPIGARIFNEFAPIFTGAGVLLLPGFLAAIWQAVKSRDARLIGVILWILGYVLLYAIRLPVVYQHGRYVFPVIAPYMLVSWVGVFKLLKLAKEQKFRRLLTFGWLGSLLIVSLAFYGIGIKTYQEDVEVIDQLMVQPAKWLAVNVPETQIIAVHDIGAMGYFTQNPLIDLAGLIDPGVIPYMHDESGLLKFMKSHGADYFVGISDWYKTSDQWGTVEKEFATEYHGTLEKVYILRLN